MPKNPHQCTLCNIWRQEHNYDTGKSSNDVNKTTEHIAYPKHNPSTNFNGIKDSVHKTLYIEVIKDHL